MRAERSNEIAVGAFLSSRRALIDPGALGLTGYGARRVSGLRREEVAMLAGLSTSYYARIEQGAVRMPSAEVLEAIAAAMLLDDDDKDYLRRLARIRPLVAAAGPAVRLDPAIAKVLHSLDTPSGVLGHDMGVLGWNRLAHRIFACHLPFEAPQDGEVNWVRTVFLDEKSRSLFVNWDDVARDIVGRLRTSFARCPGDALLTELVDAMCTTSDDFARMWETHLVRHRPLGGVQLLHPELGAIELSDTVLQSVDNDDQFLLVFHPPSGSDTASKLKALSRQLG